MVLVISAQIGSFLRGSRTLADDERDDFGIIQGATLTLLGLIIGFSFSMAITRYDQRKNYEEEEANAIGTEYVRVGLLPSDDATAVRAQLRKYLDLRIEFYKTRNRDELSALAAQTGQLQNNMWNAVQAPARAQPSAPIALVLSGMNDVLNRQGYTQAAWWNRIPGSAWGLMIAIAICANVLVGYGTRSASGKRRLLFVMPVVVAISFLLIADIDSPRTGLIHVSPQNLLSLAESLPK